MKQHTVSLFLTLDQISFLQHEVSEKIQRLIGQGAAMEWTASEWLHQEYLNTCQLARQLSEKKVEMETAELKKEEDVLRRIKNGEKHRNNRWVMNSDH